MDFSGKTVVVTGGSAGIGRETSRRFASLGAKVLVNYVSSEKDARETLDLIKSEGGEAAVCQADVSKVEEADRLMATAVDTFGGLDVLINNAGMTRFIPFEDLEALVPDVWEKIFQVNLFGVFYCCRAAWRIMKRNGAGVIVNNASLGAHRPIGSSMPYSISKSGVIHLTQCLAKTMGPEVRVNSVSPGFIGDTRWHQGRDNFDLDAQIKENARNSALKRGGYASDIASAFVFLASGESEFITGVDIKVDGGWYFYL